ncbi:MAG: penicillin-binding protein 2 [Ruminococcus sp.]|nr:penicillin-binding protein 2 [Ruminococcus sp.]
MRRRGEHAILILAILFFLIFFGISLNLLKLSQERDYVRTAADSSYITIHAGESSGTIYDRNFQPLVNQKKNIVAVAVPAEISLEELKEYAADISLLEIEYQKGKPFAFKCVKTGEESEGVTFFEIPQRYGRNIPAPHVIGYISDGEGISGLEYAYNKLFRIGSTENSVTYSTDGHGNILIGGGKSVVRSTKDKTGVVTTLDSEIQAICEKAGRSLGKGAIVVSDVRNGEILAMASFPEYDINNLTAAFENEDSPMINRCLYSFSVGSIFKLVTACEGLNEGLTEFMCNCSGGHTMGELSFACHNRNGHGVQNMKEAMTNSCNPYFITLSQCLDLQKYRSLAYNLGFGREIHLSAGIISSAGVLPSVDDLLVPAELANFSFGQGRLSATPLQINQMTCAIANGGELVMLRLIKGITVDGKTIGNEKSSLSSRVISEETSAELRKMMISAIYNNENSKATPRYVMAGAKTSTAQTEIYDESGEELCHGWITGFYPASNPRYAITVLAEHGGYGNDSAAPVFKEIVDEMMMRE